MPATAMLSNRSAEQHTRLTADQQRRLKALLTQGRQSYRDRANQYRATLDDLTGSTTVHEREVARNALQSLLVGLREHNDALARLAVGTYGVCSGCARPIPYDRLEAIPEVNQCIGCVRIG